MNADELLSLPIAEKRRIVELLWEDLGESNEPIPLPTWVDQLAAEHREEMRNPNVGLSHEDTWQRIDRRNG